MKVGVAGQRQACLPRASWWWAAGGLGSPAALYLAAAGVGVLGLADHDQVEEHNLQRQIIHDTAMVGRPKVESAARRLAALNPQVQFRLHGGGVTPANAVKLFSGYDLVVDGSDNFPTRFLNTDAAFLAKKAAVLRQHLQIRRPGCGFRSRRRRPVLSLPVSRAAAPGSAPKLRRDRSLGRALRSDRQPAGNRGDSVLLGIGESLRSRLLVVDALTMRSARSICRATPPVHFAATIPESAGSTPRPTSSPAPRRRRPLVPIRRESRSRFPWKRPGGC